jgi:hypothetical protein
MFPYDTDDLATKLGYILADAFLIVFSLAFLWALFGH